jgi:hypothetical protein
MGWPRGKSLLPTWLVLIGTSIAGAGQASACTFQSGQLEGLCAPPSADSAASIIERADVAFEGEVVDVDVAFETPCDDGLCEFGWRLRVLTPLKGQPSDIVTVFTPGPPGACGYGFTKGERLKVVAWHKRDQRLSTNLCALIHANY